MSDWSLRGGKLAFACGQCAQKPPGYLRGVSARWALVHVAGTIAEYGRTVDEAMRSPRAITLPMVPKVYPRSGSSGSRRYTPPDFAEWLELARRHIAESGVPLGIDGPVGVAIGFKADEIVLSVYPTSSNRPRGLTGDLDNYVKAVLDAAQFHEEPDPVPPLIVNDRQVDRLTTWFQK